MLPAAPALVALRETFDCNQTIQRQKDAVSVNSASPADRLLAAHTATSILVAHEFWEEANSISDRATDILRSLSPGEGYTHSDERGKGRGGRQLRPEPGV